MEQKQKTNRNRTRSKSRTRRENDTQSGAPTEAERAQYNALNHPFGNSPPSNFEVCSSEQQKWVIVHRTLYPHCAKSNTVTNCGCSTMAFKTVVRGSNAGVQQPRDNASIDISNSATAAAESSPGLGWLGTHPSSAASPARRREAVKAPSASDGKTSNSEPVTLQRGRSPTKSTNSPKRSRSKSKTRQQQQHVSEPTAKIDCRQSDTTMLGSRNELQPVESTNFITHSSQQQLDSSTQFQDSESSTTTSMTQRSIELGMESGRLPGAAPPTEEHSKPDAINNNNKESSFQTLWTLDYGEKVIRFLLLYHAEVAKFWYDEQGAGPIHRFLRSDHPSQNVLPARRVLIFMVIGFVLSAIGVWLTDDEYIVGPNQLGSPWDFPVHIAFEDVGCTVPGMKRPALQGVSGEIVPGRLTAILGQSGSGKTTFTHALLGREQQSCQPSWGKVFLNGQRRSLEAYLDRVGFVPQDDVLYPELTVEETLMFSANWRLPRTVGKEEKLRLLEETLNTLDLTRIRHQRIGDVQRRGISGGEKKRVSIGMELIASPSVLVMDEPTSGLDSAGAFRLVKTLRTIADTGVSVVTVLHQPSARVFDQIQDLILLQHGRAVYSGPRDGVMEFLHSLHYRVPGMHPVNGESTSGMNSTTGDEYSYDASQASPAEFLLDVLAGLEQPQNHTHDLPKEWQNTKAFQDQWIQIQNKLNAFQAETKSNSINSNESPYPIRPKPGLKKQLVLWIVLLFKVSWRRGVGLETTVVVCLALVVSFVRSYNTHWNRRPLANFFVSVAIGLLGMLGAVFNDDIGPVRRAANSGIILGAHEFGSLLHALVKARVSCEIFALSFFAFLYLRTEVFCTKPFSWSKYLEWVHMVHLNYVCSYVLGSVICVFVDHDPPTAYVIAVASLISVHVFAFFTPSRNQIDRDSLIFGKINTAPLVHFLCSISYVRYWMEAIILWEPEGDDRVGRNYALRHFGYREGNKTMCCNLMVVIGSIGHITRFSLFIIRNTNMFNSAHHTPLFFIFALKVFAAHAAALLLALVAHEFPTFKAAWAEVAARESRNNSRVGLTAQQQQESD